jgi:hypothetical protein
MKWLYARDYKTNDDLWKKIKELESQGQKVIVDDNWIIIYQTKV